MHTKKSPFAPILFTGFIVTSVLTLAWMVGAFLTPAPVAAAGDAGLALDFDGSNDYVNLTTGLLSGSYTKEAWVLSRDGSCRNVLSGSGSSTFWFFSNGLRSGNNGANDVIDPAPFVLNSWTHIAATYDSSSGRMTIYKNGVSVDSQLGATDPTDVVLRIGAHGSGCTFDGMIDEVRIWDHARTQGEIQASMTTLLTGGESGLTAYYQFEDGTNSSTLTDVSGNGNNGTLTNMSTATAWVSSGANLTAPSCASAPWSAASEAELNTAIDCFNNETTPGSHAINLTADIDLTASTTQINNATAGVDLVINGTGFEVNGQNGDRQPFNVASNTTVKIQDLIVKQGRPNLNGGGILNAGSLTIDKVLLQNNWGRRGGAIYSTGALTITNSVLQGNRANYTGSGSGIGGAIEHAGPTIYIANSTFTGNVTGFNSRSILRVNTGTGTIINNTIASNSSQGVELVGGITFSNNILHSNSNANCRNNSAVSGGYNISGDASCTFAATGDQTSTDPLLGTLQNNNDYTTHFEPTSSSPAIDSITSGTNGCGSMISVDQVGVSRPFNSSCDAGAIEFTPPPPTVNTTADVTADDGQCTLREAITAANSDTASGATAGECTAGNGADTIEFNIGGGGAQTISPSTALPTINTELSIDGSTQPGYAGAPLISINHSGTVLNFNGASNSTIEALNLSWTGSGTNGTGLLIQNSTNMTLQDNVISSRTIGISVSNGSDVRVLNNDLTGSGKSNNYAMTLSAVTANTLPRGIELSGNVFGNNQNGINLTNMSDQIISDGSYPGTNVTIEDSSGITSATGTVLNLSNVDETIIDDLDLSYSGTNSGTGLRINNGDGITVTNNTVSERTLGMSISNGSDTRVENNDFTDSGKSNNYALNISAVTANTLPRGLEISGNIFGGNQNGISLTNMADQIISDGSHPNTNVTIEDSSGITSATGTVLNLSNVDETIIDDLDLSYSGTNSGTGLRINNGDGITVTNNTVSERTLGMSISNGSDLRVENNDFTDSGKSNNYALNISAVTANTLPRGVEISGNIFGGNQNGISLTNMADQIISDGSHPNTNVTIEDSSGITSATGTVLNLSNVDETIIDDLDLSYSGTNSGTGLRINNGDGITVTNNTVSERTLGMSISNGSDTRVENNDFTDSGKSNNYALNISAVTANTLPRGLEISGNIFGGNQNGISLTNMADQIISDGSHPNTNVTIEDSSGITSATGTVLNLSNVDQTVIDDLELGYIGTNSGTGLRINNGNGITVTNNTVSERTLGMSISNGSDTRVENNDFTDSGKSNNYALNISAVTANTLPRGLEISGNIFGNNENGVSLTNMADQIISDGSHPNTNVTIEDSSGITNATGVVLNLSNVDQTVIDDLDLSYSGTNSGTGLRINNGDGITVTNNTVSERTIGMSISNGSDTRVENNDFTDSGKSNNYALNISAVTANTLPRGVEISGNIFGNNENGVSLTNMADQIISDGSYPNTNVTIEDSSGITSATGTVLNLSNVDQTIIGSSDLSKAGARSGTGLSLTNSDNITLTEVTVANRTTGISLNGGNNIGMSCIDLINNSTYGLSAGGAFTNLSIVDGRFQGNGTGLRNATAAQLVNAQGNFWGAADGSSSDSGSGDTYTGNVDASAFLALTPSCVTPHNNLEISKSVAPAIVLPGETITFTIEFTNTGPMAAEDLSIIDLVPTTITNTRVISSGVSVVDTNNATNYIWTIPNLGVGQSGVIHVSGQVDPAFLGSAITNTAVITGDVVDTNLANNSSTITVTIGSPNGPPTAGNDVVNINEDDGSTDISADLLTNDNDPDTDPLLFTSVDATGTTGTVTRVSDSQVTYDPNGQFETLSAGQTLTDTFSYTINDGNGESATATVAVVITGDNDNPTADADSFSVTEDSTSNLLDVLVGDADIDTLDTLSISAVGATDQGGSATISGGTQISYSPAADFVGTETFTYTVGDGNGGSAVATVTVTVTNENDDPTANPDSSSVNEDSTGNLIAVLTNDSILPDTGETLTISAVGTPDQGGSAVISGTQISYSPATNFSGSETFTYTVNDGNGGSATALVSVLVSNDNDNPTANPDSDTVDEDSTGNLIAVLANDSILPDVGETLTISTVGTPNQGGSATISGGTQISYSPPADFVGVETFSYTIGDGNGGTASSTVTIQVDNVNDDPVANPDSATVDEDSSGNAISVLTNDSILPDVGETLTISAVGTPNQGGSATVSGGTQIIYAPAANFIGTETVTYTIGDGNGGSATGTVTIQVDNLNDDPTANPDPITIQEDSVGNVLNVLANDSALPDPGETLTILAVGTTDQGGTVVNNGTDISYTPVADFFGTETFTYTIGDGNGGSATTTVTLDVQNQNDEPVVAPDTYTVTEDALTTNLDVLQNDSILPDVGETLTIIAVGNTDQNGAVSINGGTTLDYQPEPDFFGTETFTYTVNDGNGGQATGAVTIIVSAANDDPDAKDDNYAITGTDSNVNLDVLTNDTADPDTGETLSIVAVGVPTGGGTAIQSGNSIVFTPLAGFASTDIFTYTIGDGNGGFDTATVYVAVDDDRPNLAISTISFDSNLVCQGEELLVSFSVQNPGVGDAAAFAIAMYDDTSADGFDNKIGEFNMPSFPSGTNFNFNVSYVPRTLGERHIKFLADSNNVVVESVENNNGASKVLTVLEDPAPTGSITINDGAQFTNNLAMSLGLFGSDSGSCATSVSEMRFFFNGQATAWTSFSDSETVDVAAVDGEKVTVYVQLRDENKNSSKFIGQSITYDASPPESSVTGPTGATTKTAFDVSWNGTDLTSDVATYDIQVQDNGGEWIDWQVGTESAVAPFETAEVGHTYCFRSMATDTAGNVELPPVGNGDTCISVIEPITGADISIARLEFNQGIQNDSNSVPLVADRPILVRLEVGLSEDVEIEDVDAKLYGFRDGQPLEGSPLSSINGPITAKPNPNLVSETDLLHFQLPPSWRTGDIQIYAELDPDNVIDEASETNNRYPVQDFKTLSFNPTADLEITVIPIVWNKDGVIHEVTAAEIASFTDYTLRTFPLAEIKINVHSSLRHEGSEIAWLELLQDVNAIRRTELPNPAPHQIYYGLIPFPYNSYSGTAGLGYVPGSASIGFAMPGEGAGIIAAHEMGHNFGRSHVSSTHDRCGIPGRPDTNYPYPEGVIQYTGWDFGRGRLINGGTHDFMSYCSNVWISDYTYQSIYSQIKQSAVQSRAAADLSVVLGNEGYLVSGSISDDGSSGQLESAFLLESNDTPLDSQGGDFSLVLVNGDDVEIYSQPFDPVPVTEEAFITGSSNFSYLLPALDDVTGVRLYYQNILLDEFTADSGAVEDVTISSVVPEVLATDTLTLTWTDSSASAQYMVRFSADGGATWSLLAPAQSEKSLVIDVTTLQGTTNGLFEVVANDGLANKVVQSTAFTIKEQGPEVVILNSAEPVLLENTKSQLVLNGSGFDLEDGALASDQFKWSSNRDGELGTGRLLTVEDLSLGWHTITLEVADSGGNVGQATMKVLVGHTIYIPTILK